MPGASRYPCRPCTPLVCLLALAPALVPRAQALDPERRITQLTHDTWTARDGMPGGTITAITQTPDGYLWLGTSASGLVRFDGVRFVRMRELEQAFPLAPEQTRSLLTAADGTLWAGTPHGIARLRDGRWEVVDEGRSRDVAGLAETKDAALVFLRELSGFGFLRAGRLEFFPSGDGGNRALVLADDGSVWLGTDHGLRVFGADGTGGRAILEGRVNALYRDRKGRVWAATRHGLHRFVAGRLEARPADLGALSDPEITAMLEDRDGSLWLGTRGRGLRRLGARGVDSLDVRSGLSSDHVSALFEDREGSLWVGTARGLDRFRHGSFTPLGMSEGLPNDSTSAIVGRRDGTLWAFTDGGGLSRIDRGQARTFTVRDGLASNFGGPMYEAADGSLWIGHDDGLTRFRAGRAEAVRDPALAGCYVSAIAEDGQGLVAYFVGRGLRRWSGGRFVPYLLKDGSAPEVRMPFAMRRTSDGGLWLATVGGLLVIRDGTLKTIWTAPRSAVVTSLHEDAEGTLWAGSWLGLLRVREGEVLQFDAQRGLFHRRILAVTEDRKGFLWLSSPGGIFRVAKRELDEVAEGRRSSVTSEAFGVQDGLRTLEATAPAQPAVAATPDGRLWFLTQQGLASVDPERLVRNPVPPPVVIEKVLVDGREVPVREPLQIAAGVQRVEFHYNGLSLLVPERVVFRFRLEGYEAGWVDAGTRRVAHYTNVPAGRHVFRVSASNNDGVWNTAGAALTLHFAERWYRSLWFLAACAVVVAASAGGAYRARMLRHRSRERLLEERVRERTAALRQEIAERERAQEALRASEQRYELAIRGTNEGIWDWNLESGWIYYSPLWASIVGCDAARLDHSPEEWFARVHPEDMERVRAKLLGYRGSLAGRYADEFRMRHADGSYRWILSRGFAVRNADGRCERLVGAISDVTDQRAYDPLSGLPNRTLFMERLAETLARAAPSPARRCAVVVLDVDRFKLVNDSFGHEAGDALLVAVAKRISDSVRPGDLVARIAADEFALLLDSVADGEEATLVATRAQAELARPFDLGLGETFVSATIGIAVSSDHPRAADLLRDAGTALHQAKARGRGGLEVFHDGMRRHAVTAFELGTALRRSIERGDFVLHFQPVVALATGRVQGFEALVRWKHPERGLLLPGDFIGLAEETQLIHGLGRWVRKAACEQMVAWRSEGGPDREGLWLSVNVSGLEFARPEFARELRAMLRATRLPARALRLEITETVLMDSGERIAATLEGLRRLGVALDIDDFGTGYSSLSYLQELPVNALKIDRSFVARLGRFERDDAFVETILSLARKLGLTAVAEGVETIEQLQILQGLGCDAAQGYLIARPAPAEQAAALVGPQSILPADPQAVLFRDARDP